jgi:hypothetical protein
LAAERRPGSELLLVGVAHDVVVRLKLGRPRGPEAAFGHRFSLSTETRVRPPRLLTDLPTELAALIEDITFDNKGRAIPKLFSKLQASRAALEC